jgi:cell division topological specificity factor
MRKALRRLFGTKAPSKEDAKRRLKLLLIHDQLELTPSQMDDMKTEIMEVIRRYLDVDEEHTLFELDREEKGVKLVSSVPVSRVLKRSPPAA